MADFSPLVMGGLEGAADTITELIRSRRLKDEAETQRQLIRSERVADEDRLHNRSLAEAKGERERIALEQKAGVTAAQGVLQPTSVNPNQPGVDTGQMLPFQGQSLDMPVTKQQIAQRAPGAMTNLSPEAMPAFKSTLGFWQDPNVDHLAELETQLKEFQTKKAGVEADQALPESEARIRNMDEPNRAPAPSKEPVLSRATKRQVADTNDQIKEARKYLKEQDEAGSWDEDNSREDYVAVLQALIEERDSLEAGEKPVAQSKAPYDLNNLGAQPQRGLPVMTKKSREDSLRQAAGLPPVPSETPKLDPKTEALIKEFVDSGMLTREEALKELGY